MCTTELPDWRAEQEDEQILFEFIFGPGILKLCELEQYRISWKSKNICLILQNLSIFFIKAYHSFHSIWENLTMNKDSDKRLTYTEMKCICLLTKKKKEMSKKWRWVMFSQFSGPKSAPYNDLAAEDGM